MSVADMARTRPMPVTAFRDLEALVPEVAWGMATARLDAVWATNISHVLHPESLLHATAPQWPSPTYVDGGRPALMRTDSIATVAGMPDATMDAQCALQLRCLDTLLHQTQRDTMHRMVAARDVIRQQADHRVRLMCGTEDRPRPLLTLHKAWSVPGSDATSHLEDLGIIPVMSWLPRTSPPDNEVAARHDITTSLRRWESVVRTCQHVLQVQAWVPPLFAPVSEVGAGKALPPRVREARVLSAPYHQPVLVLVPP